MSALILEEQVFKAVTALHHYEQKKTTKKRLSLISDNGLLWLIISLKKIPQASKRPLRIPIPHAFHTPEETGICLITKDSKKTVKDLLSLHEVTFIDKVIPIDKLKTEFKTFERRRALCSSYGLFLTDARVYHRLPMLLGKTFYSRKRFPFPVDITKKNLKTELELAVSSTYVYLGLGQCVAVSIARESFSPQQVNENLQAVVSNLATRLPGGWKQVQCVHIKTHSSVALPLYKSLPELPSRVEIEGSAVKVSRKRLPDSSTSDQEEVPEEGSDVIDEDECLKTEAKKVKRIVSVKKSSKTQPLRIRGSRIRKPSKKLKM